MAGARGNQASLAFAKQTGKGAPNTTYTDRLPFTGGSINPTREIDNLSETDANRDQGVAFLQSFGVEGSPEVYVRDTNIHHILESALGTLGTAGSGPYTHTVTPANVLPYYSFYKEVGGLLFEQYTDCKISELTISADAGQPLTATMNLMGRTAERLTVGPSNVSEVQTLTITGTPTGGTYVLTYNGQNTTALAFDADAATITSALEALTLIGAGNVLVTGTGPYTITFQGALASKGVNLIKVDSSGLTGGTTPSASVVTTTQGATALPSLANSAVYNYNEAKVVLGGTQVANVGSFELTIGNNVSTQQTDDAKVYDVIEGLREVTLGFNAIFEDVVEYDKFHYGGSTGVDQSSALNSTSAVFTFSKGASNSISFSLPDISYTEFPVEPDAGGDPVTSDVQAVANRGASPVVTGTVVNSQAT